MKRIFFAALMLVIAHVSFAQDLPAEKIVGIWASKDADVGLRFELFQSQGKYFGKLLWASTMFEADGKTPKKDCKNPDKKLRGRSRQNIINITNLTFDNGEYTGGKLYNPDDGRTYSLKARLVNLNEMEFRGYMSISLLGKTMKFKRVE